MTPVLETGEWVTGFDFKNGKAVRDGRHVEGEAVAGLACIEYMAWARFGDARHLGAAAGMDALQKTRHNPFYEILLPFGVTLAARMNAEQGTTIDVERMPNWCMEADTAAAGWASRRRTRSWHPIRFRESGGKTAPLGSDHRKMGQLRHRRADPGLPVTAVDMAVRDEYVPGDGGTGPLPRYRCPVRPRGGEIHSRCRQHRRLLYANGLPPENQTCYDQRDATRNVVAYEGRE